MTRIQSLFGSLIIACFSLSAAGCLEMEDEFDGADEAYLEPVDELEVPDEPLRGQLPPGSFLEPAGEVATLDEPLRAVLPPGAVNGNPSQPGASFLDAAGEIAASEPPRGVVPDDDDDADNAAADQGGRSF